LYKGRIVRSGGKDLALEVEKKGYDWLIKEQCKLVTGGAVHE
jgi:Fe-S cluster assembly ATP-binding protein